MQSNQVLDTLMQRKSIRKYRPDPPSDEVVEAVARAGFQAPFAYQLCSVLWRRGPERVPYRAPLLFTICVDAHRHERVMAERCWRMVSNDLSLLIFGMQDASLVAESLGMGSCLIGDAPELASKIVKEYRLPPRVFPLVRLVMGYPAEAWPPRPRYPLQLGLFEDAYPEMSEEAVREGMRVMDEGYQAQNYYRRQKAMIELEGGRQETYDYDTYSWTEHISRKTGQWDADPAAILKQFAACGFRIPGHFCPEPGKKARAATGRAATGRAAGGQAADGPAHAGQAAEGEAADGRAT
jgi:nitroreductase